MSGHALDSVKYSIESQGTCIGYRAAMVSACHQVDTDLASCQSNRVLAQATAAGALAVSMALCVASSFWSFGLSAAPCAIVALKAYGVAIASIEAFAAACRSRARGSNLTANQGAAETGLKTALDVVLNNACHLPCPTPPVEPPREPEPRDR